MCVSGGKKCLFFGNFGVLCSLETPVSRFALLPYYRRSSPSSFLGRFCCNIQKSSQIGTIRYLTHGSDIVSSFLFISLGRNYDLCEKMWFLCYKNFRN